MAQWTYLAFVSSTFVIALGTRYTAGCCRPAFLFAQFGSYPHPFGEDNVSRRPE